MKLALIVEYETKPGNESEFDAVLRAHALRCLDEEPGCLRFEVIRPLDEEGNIIPNRFMANELFSDREALTAHRSTARFEKISEQFRILLVNRRPILCATDA
jgi:autoinducer 2-degrading protein